MLRSLLGVGPLHGFDFTSLVAEVGIELGRFSTPWVDRVNCRIVDGAEILELEPFWGSFADASRWARVKFIRDRVLTKVTVHPWEESASALRPVLMSDGELACAILEAILSRGADGLRDVAYQQIAPGLFVRLVVDANDRLIRVRTAMLELWGVTFAQAFDVARQNLRENSDPLTFIEEEGLWILDQSDTYAAARVLLASEWHLTNPLVAVPNRETLMLAEPDRSDAVERLMLRAHWGTCNQDHEITLQIYQLDGSTLRPWRPTTSEGIASRYLGWLRISHLEAYERQHRLHEHIDGISLAPLELTARISSTIWTRGIPTMFPEADRVRFVDGDISWDVPWESVVRAGWIIRTDWPFPHWAAGEFPSKEWLDAHAGQRPVPD